MVVERSAANRAIAKIRAGHQLIRKARNEALEWIIVIIAQYFIEAEERRRFFEFEVLTRDCFTVSQKIRILADVLTASNMPMVKQYPKLVQQLERLNSYRNLLAYGLPVPTSEAADVWIHRRQLRPISIDRAEFSRMEGMFEESFKALGEIYAQMIRA